MTIYSLWGVHCLIALAPKGPREVGTGGLVGLGRRRKKEREGKKGQREEEGSCVWSTSKAALKFESSPLFDSLTLDRASSKYEHSPSFFFSPSQWGFVQSSWLTFFFFKCKIVD